MTTPTTDHPKVGDKIRDGSLWPIRLGTVEALVVSGYVYVSWNSGERTLVETARLERSRNRHIFDGFVLRTEAPLAPVLPFKKRQ